MASRLQELSGGKLMVVLEGGYNIEATALAAEATVRSLLGQKLPLSCSESRLTAEEVLSNIYMSELHYKDIQASLDHWSKYWHHLLTDPALIEFEKKHKVLSTDRRMIAGPPCENPRSFKSDYEITLETFSKFIPESELSLNLEFFRNNSRFCPELLSSEKLTDGRIKLEMKNLLHESTRVIANFYLHATNFDELLATREKELLAGGASFFQLKYGLKQMVTHQPLFYK